MPLPSPTFVVAEAAPSAAGRSLQLRQQLLRSFLLLLLIGLYAPTVAWLYARWTMSVWHNAHGLLVPPVVAYLVWRELKRLRDLPASSDPWGFALLAPALLLHALDAGMRTQLLSAATLVLVCPGLSLLLLGRARTRAILFPLLCLSLMLPIPLAVTERVHLVLREIATVGTAVLLPLLGISVYAEDTTLYLAGNTLLVGDACSGFSTLYAAVATAALTAYSCDSGRRRAMVLIAAVPLAIAANILRVTLLAVLTVSQGVAILDTSVHPLSGVLTFVLVLPIIFWLGRPVGTVAEAGPR